MLPLVGVAKNIIKGGRQVANLAEGASDYVKHAPTNQLKPPDAGSALPNISINKAKAPEESDFVSGWRRLTVKDVPLPDNVRKTFKNGEATPQVLQEDTAFYRVFGERAGRRGAYMSRHRPGSAEQAIDTLALDPEWQNTAVHLVEVRVPKGTVIWEGLAEKQAGLPGGGNQVWVSPDQFEHMADDVFRVIPW